MKKILAWMKKHVKLVILLAVIALIAIGVYACRQKTKETMAALSEMSEETAIVERRSIQQTVSSTGKIISDSTRTLSAGVTGLKILTVDVEVGDIVNIGDPICSFDVSDIEDNLADAEKTLKNAEKQSAISVNNARRSLEQATENKNYQIENASRSVLSAYDTYIDAVRDYDDAKKGVDDAYDRMVRARQESDSANAVSVTALQQARDSAEAEKTAAQAAKDSAEAAFKAADDAVTEAQNAGMPAEQLEPLIAARTVAEGEQTKAQTALDDATDKYNAAVDAFNAYDDTKAAAASANYESAKAAYESADDMLSKLDSAISKAKLAYDGAVATYEFTIQAQESNSDASWDAYSGAKSGASVATLQQESAISGYQKQLEKGVLTADTAGTVTAVNIHEGDNYAGGAVVTIQDCDQLVVSAEIDEYDIADVKLGMKAIFRTDATREEQLVGEVIFISPTPTQGSDVTYQVKVKILSDASRLRIGMNAKLNIIFTETADVLTVPFDAIQQDEDGNDFVNVITRTDEGVTKLPVPVTVGVEGDYYVEISGSITEGTEVSLPTDNVFDFAAMMQGMYGGE